MAQDRDQWRALVNMNEDRTSAAVLNGLPMTQAYT
jgi:hypothetical protein